MNTKKQSSTHTKGVSGSFTTASGTQINASNRRSVHCGAPKGNQNAKKSLEWDETFDLSTPSGIESFLVEVIKAVWEGRLGTRAGSTLNGALHLLVTEARPLSDLESRIKLLEERKVN